MPAAHTTTCPSSLQKPTSSESPSHGTSSKVVPLFSPLGAAALALAPVFSFSVFAAAAVFAEELFAALFLLDVLEHAVPS